MRDECVTWTVRQRRGDRSKCGQQARPSTHFVDSTDLSWRNFLLPGFTTKVQREVPVFLEIPDFPHNAALKGRKLPCQTRSLRLTVSIELPLATDAETGKQTDRQTQGHS